MQSIIAGNLFRESLLLYLLAAVLPLFFLGRQNAKRQKLCNILSNVACAAASLAGAASAAAKLIWSGPDLLLGGFSSALPFLSIELRVDNLAAVFLLALSVLTLSASVYSIGYISHYIGKRNVAAFNFLFSSFILSMILVLTSSGMIFFYIAWEAMSLLSYFS